MMVIERINRSGDIFLEVPEEEDCSEFLIAVDPGHFIGTPARRTPQMPNVIEDDEGNLQLCWEGLTSDLAEGLARPSFETITPDGIVTIVTEDGVVTPSDWNVSAERENPAFGIPGESQMERIQMREWEFNNAVATHLIELLNNRGYSVLNVAPEDDPMMDVGSVSGNDNGVSNTIRVNRANYNGSDASTFNTFGRAADFFFSIHANADGAAEINREVRLFTSAHGLETFHQPSNATTANSHETSLEYARIIHRHLINNGREYGLVDRQRVGMRNPPGPQPHSGTFVLTGTTMPAVLIEAGFFTNFREAVLLMDETYRRRVAIYMFNAINEIYELWREEQESTE